MLNFNTQGLDDLAARIGKAIENLPAKDIEKNVKALLQSGLMRLDLVTRQEFDTQAQVLLRTREKVERLEARLAELEGRARIVSTASAPTDKSPPPSIAPAE
jgi:BMFP domain-containing protein YqiC